MKRIFILASVLFFLCLTNGKSQDILGSHITYTSLDSVTYVVKVVIYQNCSNATAPRDTIRVEWGSGNNYFNSRIHQVAVTDVTGYGQGCPVQSRCVDTGLYGLREIIYLDTISLSGINACTIKLIWTGLRVKPSSGPAEQYYNYSILNKCLVHPNSSVIYLDRLKNYFLRTGQDYVIKPPAVIKTNYTDSLSVDYVCPLKTADSAAEVFVNSRCGGNCGTMYFGFGNYCTVCPLDKFLGAPNAGLSAPAGCQYYSDVQEFHLRPNQTGEFKYYCYETSEWRKVGSARVLIGLTRFDMSSLVISDNNYYPGFPGTKHWTACARKQFCATIPTYDSRDTTRVSWINGDLSGATFTNNNGSVKRASATVCWTPTDSNIRERPYIFTLTVSDNNCNLNGTSTETFKISVVPGFDTSNYEFQSKTVKCHAAFLTAKRKVPVANLSFSWKGDEGQTAAGDSAILVFAKPGWHKFYMIPSTPNCQDIYTDSVFIYDMYTISTEAKNDTAICKGAGSKIFVYPLNGMAPYSYYWDGLGADSAYSVNPQSTIQYRARILDGNYCLAYDSVTITVNSQPLVDIGPDRNVCAGTPFTLTATPVAGPMPFKYQWQNTDTAQSIKDSVVAPKKYSVTVTDQNGCAGGKSVNIGINPVEVKAFGDTTLCFGGTATVKAKALKGKAPFAYSWAGTALTADSGSIYPAASGPYLVKLTEANGCIAYDTVDIMVIKQGTVTLQADTGLCRGFPVTLRLLAHTVDTPVKIYWNGVEGGDSLSLQVNSDTSFIVKVMDKLACKAEDTVQVQAYAHPIVKAAGDTLVCKRTTVSFSAVASGGLGPYSYKWSNGVATDNFSITAFADKMFTVKTTDIHGCSGTDSVRLQVKAPDKLIITPQPPVCQTAEPLILQVFPQNGMWQGAGVSNGRFHPLGMPQGDNHIYYAFPGSDGCPQLDSLDIKVIAAPSIDFTTDTDSGIAPFSVHFTNATTSLTNAWFWDFDNPKVFHGDTSSLENPDFTFRWPGVYNVEFTASLFGCSAKTSKKIRVYEQKVTTNINSITNYNIFIYPNPSENVLYIEENNIINTITIYDIFGKEVLKKVLNETRACLDISLLHSGIYFVETDTLKVKGLKQKIIVMKE